MSYCAVALAIPTSYAMAVNVNRGYKAYGWTVHIRGVQAGGEVINLTIHTFPTDDGDIDLKRPTEMSDRREARLRSRTCCR